MYVHSVRVQSSGPTFRGFAVQSRASSADFGTSSDSGFIGEFVNPGGDWQIWSCPGGVSATSIIFVTFFLEPPNKGHVGDNINSAVLSFVERLSSLIRRFTMY